MTGWNFCSCHTFGIISHVYFSWWNMIWRPNLECLIWDSSWPKVLTTTCVSHCETPEGVLELENITRAYMHGGWTVIFRWTIPLSPLPDDDSQSRCLAAHCQLHVHLGKLSRGTRKIHRGENSVIIVMKQDRSVLPVDERHHPPH